MRPVNPNTGEGRYQGNFIEWAPTARLLAWLCRPTRHQNVRICRCGREVQVPAMRLLARTRELGL